MPAAYAAKAVYVFGVAPNTACGLRLDAGRPRMVGTSRGDGTVTWDSGRIGGIGSFYYLPAAHGDLLSSRPHFDALTDLLVSGSTGRLATTPPAVRAIDAARPRTYDPGPPEMADTGNAELALLGGTPSQQVQPRARRQLALTVRGMDLRFVDTPILVGQYQNDPIAGPQALIDTELLGGKLSQRHDLGLYAGPLGSATVVLQAPNRAEQVRGSLVGAVVTGLGDYSGALSQDALVQAVRAGVLRYLLQAVDVLGSADRELPLATLLLGYNSSANLSVAASLEALVRGVLEANARFKDSTGLNLRVHRLDIVELYLDTAITAAYELRQLQPRLAALAGRLDTQLLLGAELLPGDGLRQRLFDSGAGNYWPRLMVTDADSADRDAASAPSAASASASASDPAEPPRTRLASRLRYLFVGQRARAEAQLQQRQPGLIETLVSQQIDSAVWSEDFGRLLFQLLVPPDFKDTLRQLNRVVLVVDAATANLPWELMLPDAPARPADGRSGTLPSPQPLAVRTSVVRQLASMAFRRQVRQATSRHALVVGNPSVAGFASSFPDPRNPKGLDPDALPGAEAEAQAVHKLLGGVGYQVSRAIGQDASAAVVLAKLYRQAYRVLHISAHGVFEQRHRDGQLRSGVVLSGGLLITATEIAAMEAVPELVFLNCCHLGQVDATVRQGNKLAASVARELIDIGVRCVVVAGWAVTDSLAQLFGEVFYTELMQQHQTFGDAVHTARLALWDKQPGDITWGAFQAYGDPGWRAEPRADAAGFGGGGDDPFVSMEELLDQLARARAEMTRRPERQTEAARQALVKRLDSLLAARCPVAWLGRPALLSALGATWRDLGEPERAYRDLLAAVQADDQSGRVPIRDIEQLANIEARLGEKVASRALAAAPTDDAALQRGLGLIQQAIDRLTLLDSLVASAVLPGDGAPASTSTPTPHAERAALLGSAWKRLAAVRAQQCLTAPAQAPAAQRRALLDSLLQALRAAAQAYQRGEGQPGSPLFKPYNTLNRLALDSLAAQPADPDGAAGQAEARALAAQCRQALAALPESGADLWRAVMLPETVLVEHLGSGGLAASGEAAEAAWLAVSSAYAQALDSVLIKPWQLDSVVSHLALLARFSLALDWATPDAHWQRQAAQLDRLARQLQPTRAPAAAPRPR